MSERYPLWCVDKGYWRDVNRFAGPYDTEAEAIEERRMHDGATVRRCRRIRAAEIDGLRYAYDRLVESLDEQARGGDVTSTVPEAWADWEDELVHECDGAAEAFREFVDKWLRVDAYVCEGDEPAQEGEVTKTGKAYAAIGRRIARASEGGAP